MFVSDTHFSSAFIQLKSRGVCVPQNGPRLPISTLPPTPPVQIHNRQQNPDQYHHQIPSWSTSAFLRKETFPFFANVRIYLQTAWALGRCFFCLFVFAFACWTLTAFCSVVRGKLKWEWLVFLRDWRLREENTSPVCPTAAFYHT